MSHPACTPSLSCPHARQRGAAAVEFALTITMLLVMALAIAGFGFLAWAQQRLSAMAGEGARVALLASYQDPVRAGASACQRVRHMADDALLLSGVGIQCRPVSLPCGWSDANGNAQPCMRLELSGDVSGWPLLRLLGSAFALLGEGQGETQGYRLRTSATIQIASGG